MTVKLSYSFAAEASLTAPYGEPQLQNTLYAMLAAVRDTGSIGKAAERLGLSYRHLWGTLKKHEQSFGESLLAGSQGQAARLSEFGERLLWAERRIIARVLPQAESLANRIDRDLQLAIDPRLASIPVCASHDLLFGPLRERLRRGAGLILDIDYQNSAVSLDRLNSGACQIGGIHLPLVDPSLCRRGSTLHAEIGRNLKLGEHKLIRFSRREQGLIVPRGNPLGLKGVADLLSPGIQFVNRPMGTGTRVLLDELCRKAGIIAGAIEGFRNAEPTHQAVAATIAAREANCGFGLRVAAERFDLDFVPVIAEEYFIVCRKAMLDTPAIAALIEILQSENFRRLVDALPGYAAGDSGEIVSLRRTLPWYK